MSSAKWRRFCLGLNVLIKRQRCRSQLVIWTVLHGPIRHKHREVAKSSWTTARRTSVIIVKYWHLAADFCIAINSSSQDKMAAISQTTFSNAFSWMKRFIFRFEFHWSLFPKGPIHKKSTWVQVMAWHRTGGKPLPKALSTRITDAYMRH